jgi:hypothetical protein
MWLIVKNNDLQCLRFFVCKDNGLRRRSPQISMDINARSDCVGAAVVADLPMSRAGAHKGRPTMAVALQTNARHGFPVRALLAHFVIFNFTNTLIRNLESKYEWRQEAADRS